MSTLGNTLVGVGAFVGLVVVAAMAMDYVPSLSPEMVKLLFYKGLGAAAVGLMIAGTWIARHGHENHFDASGRSAVQELHSAPTHRILLDESSAPPTRSPSLEKEFESRDVRGDEPGR